MTATSQTKLVLYHLGELRYSAALSEPVEVGRQYGDEVAEVWTLTRSPAGVARLIIADRNERSQLSRNHLLLTPLEQDRVRVQNTSERPVLLGEMALDAGAEKDVSLPSTIHLLNRRIELQGRSKPIVRSLGAMTYGMALQPSPTRYATLPPIHTDQIDPMIDWLHQTTGLINGAIRGENYLTDACHFLVDHFRFHSASVLLGAKGENLAAVWGRELSKGPAADPSGLLEQVRTLKRTCYLEPTAPIETITTQVILVSPLLDEEANLIGFLCGEQRGLGASVPGRLEAALVELLASGLSVRLISQKTKR
jgi:hypothetical protein